MARTRSWKNKLITGLISSLRPKPTCTPTPEKILVVSTTALGDTLWATPSLFNLRRSFPSAHIAVLTSPIGLAVLQHNPDIDQLLLLKEPLLTHFLPLLSQLKREKFDTALLFHASQRLALPLCALSGIGRILGTPGINKGLDDLLTDPIAPQFEHEIERRLRMTEALGTTRRTETLSYYVQPEERAAAKQFLNASGKRIVAMHPGSKEPFRRWPPRYFAAVGQALQKEFNCEILLTGTPSEEPLLHEIQTLLPTARIAPTRASLRSLAALLEQTDLLLSNDTGPFHLACAVNRPAVGLYVSTDPRLCGPHKAPLANTISRAPTCKPCIKRRCEEPFCFLQIAPPEVIEACKRAISR